MRLKICVIWNERWHHQNNWKLTLFMMKQFRSDPVYEI
jgi:hypothetical protein